MRCLLINIDYAQYTDEELEDVWQHIDDYEYAERAVEIYLVMHKRKLLGLTINLKLRLSKRTQSPIYGIQIIYMIDTIKKKSTNINSEHCQLKKNAL
jgi:hypothetical protein